MRHRDIRRDIRGLCTGRRGAVPGGTSTGTSAPAWLPGKDHFVEHAVRCAGTNSISRSLAGTLLVNVVEHITVEHVVTYSRRCTYMIVSSIRIRFIFIIVPVRRILAHVIHPS